MGETFCQKYWICCALYFIVLLCTNVFLFYAGWWLPIEINNHRLRYSQLEDMEIYTFKLSDWDRYHVDTERINVLNFKQQKDYVYRYMFGIFESNVTDFNFSLNGDGDDLGDIFDGNLDPVTQRYDDLIDITWDDFSELVNHLTYKSDIHIIQYSASKCISSNDTNISNPNDFDVVGFETCLIDWYQRKNGTNPPHYLIYTEIEDITEFPDVNSQQASATFDAPRDTFMFLIMTAMFIWLFLMMDAMEDQTIGFQGLNFLVITLFFIGVYYLYVFCLSVIPISFSTPVGKGDMEYYTEFAYSLSYTFGDYDPRWWVAGVLLQGVWCYTLVLFIPIVGIFFFIISCICCCDEDRIDKYGSCFVIFLLLLGLVILIMMTITFFIIFLGNLSMWNDNTYTPVDNDWVICSITAIVTVYILLPTLAGLIYLTTVYNKRYEDKEKKPILHLVGKSLTNLPVVKNRVSAGQKPKKKKVANEPNEIETQPITQQNNNNKQAVADDTDHE